ncbi:MAG: 30S ribosomal protein S19e [Candidatus Nanoarchaeia archaeon]|nr:30S ribosomal protein S19e [Candidatus Nanoarchaeia archaeon]
MVMYNTKPEIIVEKTALELKKTIKAPEWSKFVKTGVAKERPPEDLDWWYKRAASILRKIYMYGPIGVSKLRVKYGSKKNRKTKPEKFYRASGKVIRTILQQLEEQKLIEKAAKGVHKGRIITNKGKSLLDKIGKDGNKVVSKEEKTGKEARSN